MTATSGRAAAIASRACASASRNRSARSVCTTWSQCVFIRVEWDAPTPEHDARHRALSLGRRAGGLEPSARSRATRSSVTSSASLRHFSSESSGR